LFNFLDIIYIQTRFRRTLNYCNLFVNRNIELRSFITFIQCIQNICGFILTYRPRSSEIYVPEIHRVININITNCETLNNNIDICFSVDIITYYYSIFIQFILIILFVSCVCSPVYYYFDRHYNLSLNNSLNNPQNNQFLRRSLFSRHAVLAILSRLQNTNEPPVNDVCSICSSVTEYDEWKTLNCSHKFHTVCIENWVMQGISPVNEKCPICRENITSNYTDIERPLLSNV